ncbi:MAG: alpha/beta hydrolase, partial [Actinomycetota bacterium]
MTNQVLEGCEDFAFGEGRSAALLVHGFTGSPQAMRALGEYLAERGIAVVGPRLPGHGTSWQDLATRTGDEWSSCVENAFHEAAGRHDEVLLVGLSFGAPLCLDLAARYPDRVAGFVGLASFITSRDPRRFLAPVIRRLVRSLPGVGNDIADADSREIVYDRVPTAAAHQVLRYCRRVLGSLEAVRCPLLLVHSRNDHTAHPVNVKLIHDRVSSEDKEIVWL